MSIGVGIIGCGLIGHKRAGALGSHRLVACADLNYDLANVLAKSAKTCMATDDWREVINNQDVSVVIVATPHHVLSEIAAAAIEAGRHVLVEKPAARNAEELRPLVRQAEIKDVRVRVGFNHRYHRALRKMHEILNSGELGPLMFLRARYGHGGRVGYDREWRADPALSGGGGPHQPMCHRDGQVVATNKRLPAAEAGRSAARPTGDDEAAAGLEGRV